ncbi:hypothetical protein T440DRAFT_469575 [Plenodomus tracheiphilus IPT5]|uniref:Uncharacterized protein n=1 Tax=Plenodomus tracheiphilus IPT5 TaxID=1408161 RepID=A0A6A7B3C6_9PLEO|nr:hypothetical protein T440DRAFT_469575 [Plenodomus tracheiphilus IPT5]
MPTYKPKAARWPTLLMSCDGRCCCRAWLASRFSPTMSKYNVGRVLHAVRMAQSVLQMQTPRHMWRSALRSFTASNDRLSPHSHQRRCASQIHDGELMCSMVFIAPILRFVSNIHGREPSVMHLSWLMNTLHRHHSTRTSLCTKNFPKSSSSSHSNNSILALNTQNCHPKIIHQVPTTAHIMGWNCCSCGTRNAGDGAETNSANTHTCRNPLCRRRCCHNCQLYMLDPEPTYPGVAIPEAYVHHRAFTQPCLPQQVWGTHDFVSIAEPRHTVADFQGGFSRSKKKSSSCVMM